ncbi:acyl-CoA dehydrogenase family protein [Nocardia sp. NPDC052112]|uniref:acyl-CoA dehydrogenase family protein n=1 Tax=Nocardia sp. NPDC052112 TaxID=3155646 RepID=UPI0034365B38
MSMTFDLDPATAELAARMSKFVGEVVIPEEARSGISLHHGDEQLRQRLVSSAKEFGVYGPHVPEEFGGHGLSLLQLAVVFEQAGRSLLGPLAIQAQAPDEGNINLLDKVANSEQRQRFLAPLAAGDVRSCIVMTEPNGAGSDPNALTTTARRSDRGWVINGRKWFISGAHGAAFGIVLARSSGEWGDRGGATMFLVDMNTPGLEEVRVIDSLDEGYFGGHSELLFTDVEVSDDAVLGEVDLGLKYAQVRLGPARMTHCMRWLGIAQRSQEIAIERAIEREVFGAKLSELGMVQQLIADNEIDLEASRALLYRTCAELDSGATATRSTSITKTFVSEALGRVVDRSIQICGALGISYDTPLSRFYRELRPFRIYDGPSEVHRWAIARRAVGRFEANRTNG